MVVASDPKMDSEHLEGAGFHELLSSEGRVVEFSDERITNDEDFEEKDKVADEGKERVALFEKYITRDEENESDDDLTSDEDERSEEAVQLSDSIFIYQNKKMSDRGNVFEGEIRSGVYGVRRCAIKFARKSEENVREARILTELGSHTHVVSIIQSGIYKDMFEERVFIALDKCHDQNLRQHLISKKESGLEFNLDEVLEYSKQIIAGVIYIHEKLIIHKDLKPSNILLSMDKSTIKLADFGLSQEIKSTSSKVYNKHQFGTIGYRPPESFGNSWASLKSDTFSVGAVLYFILSNGESPFGDDIHLWIYNTKHGVKDFSKLLAPNNKAFGHLIELMMDQDRQRRPSIWQVADHPCWSGRDIECDFDYGCEEETDDSGVVIPEKQDKELNDSENETENIIEFVRDLMKLGIGISPSATSRDVIIFDRKTNYLQLLNTQRKAMIPMHEFNDVMKKLYFTAVSIDDCIYVMTDKSLYRLFHREAGAKWEQLADLIYNHGFHPPAVALYGAIYVAGSSGSKTSKSASKYDPVLNRWEKIQHKQLATKGSVVVASQGYVYCIGGAAGVNITRRVERLNIRTQVWTEIAPMLKARYQAAAVDFNGKLLVAGGESRYGETLNSVEKYDVETNQWTTFKRMIQGRCSPWFRCHVIGGNVWAIGGDENDQTVEVYNVESDKWEIVKLSGSEMKIRQSLAVQSVHLKSP